MSYTRYSFLAGMMLGGFVITLTDILGVGEGTGLASVLRFAGLTIFCILVASVEGEEE